MCYCFVPYFIQKAIYSKPSKLLITIFFDLKLVGLCTYPSGLAYLIDQIND